MVNRSVLHSPRLEELKKKRRRDFQKKVWGIGILIVLFLGGLVYLTRIKQLSIQVIHIAGNKIVDGDEMQKIVEAEIAGKYLWIFPKSNFLLYPKTKIKTDLANNFKRLKDISINVKDFKDMEINVNEHVGQYTWCGMILPDKATPASASCYFMDGSGYIFDNAPYFSGSVYFKFYGPTDPRADFPPGTHFFKQNFLGLVAFKDSLVSLGVKPVSILLTSDGDLEVYLATSSTQTNMPKILLKSDADFQKLSENLKAALSTETLTSDFKNKYTILQYIDLRFGNKVYYKFQ